MNLLRTETWYNIHYPPKCLLACTPLNTQDNYYFNWMCLSSNKKNPQMFWEGIKQFLHAIYTHREMDLRKKKDLIAY